MQEADRCIVISGRYKGKKVQDITLTGKTITRYFAYAVSIQRAISQGNSYQLYTK